MESRIITTRMQNAGYETGEDVDNYMSRVIKFIPAEVIGAWIVIKNLVLSANDASQNVLLWGCFAILVVATAAWTYRKTARPQLPVAKTQIVISTLAFVVWVWGVGEPFASVVPHSELLSSLTLVFFTLGVGWVVPPE